MLVSRGVDVQIWMNHNKHHQSETRANVKDGSPIYLKASIFGWGQFQIGVRYISHHASVYPERIRSFRSWRLVHAVSIFKFQNWMLSCSIHPIIFLQNYASQRPPEKNLQQSACNQASAMKKLVVRFLHALFLRALGLRSWTGKPMASSDTHRIHGTIVYLPTWKP